MHNFTGNAQKAQGIMATVVEKDLRKMTVGEKELMVKALVEQHVVFVFSKSY